MTKAILYKISNIVLILGFLLIGLGVGILFQKGLIGLTLGIGVGFVLSSFNTLRIIKRMDIYNKIEI